MTKEKHIKVRMQGPGDQFNLSEGPETPEGRASADPVASVIAQAFGERASIIYDKLIANPDKLVQLKGALAAGLNTDLATASLEEIVAAGNPEVIALSEENTILRQLRETERKVDTYLDIVAEIVANDPIVERVQPHDEEESTLTRRSRRLTLEEHEAETTTARIRRTDATLGLPKRHYLFRQYALGTVLSLLLDSELCKNSLDMAQIDLFSGYGAGKPIVRFSSTFRESAQAHGHANETRLAQLTEALEGYLSRRAYALRQQGSGQGTGEESPVSSLQEMAFLPAGLRATIAREAPRDIFMLPIVPAGKVIGVLQGIAHPDRLARIKPHLEELLHLIDTQYERLNRLRHELVHEPLDERGYESLVESRATPLDTLIGFAQGTWHKMPQSDGAKLRFRKQAYEAIDVPTFKDKLAEAIESLPIITSLKDERGKDILDAQNLRLLHVIAEYFTAAMRAPAVINDMIAQGNAIIDDPKRNITRVTYQDLAIDADRAFTTVSDYGRIASDMLRADALRLFGRDPTQPIYRRMFETPRFLVGNYEPAAEEMTARAFMEGMPPPGDSDVVSLDEWRRMLHDTGDKTLSAKYTSIAVDHVLRHIDDSGDAQLARNGVVALPKGSIIAGLTNLFEVAVRKVLIEQYDPVVASRPEMRRGEIVRDILRAEYNGIIKGPD